MIGTSALALLSLLATAAARDASAAPVETEGSPGPELRRIRPLAVYFGHQSVGADVLEGVARLARRAGVPLALVEAPSAVELSGGTWVHTAVGVNGDPASKLAAFARGLDAASRDPDVALLKLCWADFHAGTDPVALLDAYRATLAELKARHPHTRFVHVTTPLTARDGWARGLAKRVLGREPADAQNARRERYNALLRAAFVEREPVFDLARLESACGGGATQPPRWRGADAPSLCPEYTDDGGHLNAAGQEKAARALVRLLAALAPEPAP